MIKLKTKEEIAILAEGGHILAEILRKAKEFTKIGTHTDEINDFVHDLIIKNNAVPAFLDYTPDGAMRPFPASLCVCINNEIVHGIPNENVREIKDGDILTLDGGIIYKDMYTDHAITFVVGENKNPEIKKLLQKTEEALYAGIKQAKVGNRIGDIGHAIAEIADGANLSIIEHLSGHGVGFKVHEDPYVPNFGEVGTGPLIEEGLVIAIEPMFSLGKPAIKLGTDGYVYKTKDGSLSAQFEHTIAVTADGPVILTK